MKKETKGLNQLALEAHENSKAKGFYDDEDGKNIALKQLLIISEIAEGCEALRINKRFDSEANPWSIKAVDAIEDQHLFENVFKVHVKDTFEDELADAIIRILDLAAYQNIDIENHVALKMRYNSTRPYKHGKKF